LGASAAVLADGAAECVCHKGKAQGLRLRSGYRRHTTID